MFGEAQDLVWHSSREKSDLNITWQILEDVLNLLLEASGEHLVCLIHDEEPEVICFENTLLHHIVNSTWSSYNDVDSLFKELDVLSNAGTSDTGVNFNTHVFADGVHNEGDLQGQFSGWCNNERLDVLTSDINRLQCCDSKCSCFTGSRLCLYLK